MDFIELLTIKKQVILYGPPGTGKTYLARKISKGGEEKKQLEHIMRSNNSFLIFVTDQDWNGINWFKNNITVNVTKLISTEEISGHPIFLFVGGPNTEYSRIMAIGRVISYNSEQNFIQIENIQKIKSPHSTVLKSHSIIQPIMDEYSIGKIVQITNNVANEILEISTLYQSENIITFHSSYSYEEFIEGFRPNIDSETKQVYFKINEGFFKKVCRVAFNALMDSAGYSDIIWEEGSDVPTLLENQRLNALKQVESTAHYIIIDEINRGDISRIFGELLTLIEYDKRLCEENEITLPLLYSQTKFGIPPNLFIIGTMNTADRSIALLDIALRRRFGFVEIIPNSNIIREIKKDKDNNVQTIIETSAVLLDGINQKIIKEYDRDHQIGHSYFMKLKNCSKYDDALTMLKLIWNHDIVPLLQEYFYDNDKQITNILGVVLYDEKKKEFLKIDNSNIEVFLREISKIKPYY